jgi:hypothetical protein
MGTHAENLVGIKFGRLTVIERAAAHTGSENKYGKKRNAYHPRVYWKCRCDCGNFVEPNSDNLKSGNTISCGCARKKHGMCGTKEERLFSGAKGRAKKEGLPFNLALEDVVIPEFCPVFPNLRLNRDAKVNRQKDSPSLDKIQPHLGYVKGNVVVVSWRANELKRNASWQELLTVATWLRSKIGGNNGTR